MHALPHLSAVDWLSLAIFFGSWAGYGWFSEHSRWGAKGLIGTSRNFRLQWAYQMLARDTRVMDSTLIGNLMTSVSFYANTTIYIIAGMVAALGAADKLISVTAELPFGGAGNRELLEIKLMLLLASFVFAYFKFTWSLRQFNLLSILVGAAPHGAAPASRGSTPMRGGWPGPTISPATISIAASALITSGWPASGWLLQSLPCWRCARHACVLLVLYRRDFRLAEALALLHREDDPGHRGAA